MTSDETPFSKVEAYLEEVPEGDPRCWVNVLRKGMKKAEEISYRELLARPSVIPEDKVVKQEASRQYRTLIKEWRLKTVEIKPAAPTLEIKSVQSDRSPHAKGFDPTKHITIYYLLDGKEHQDVPSSLDRMIRETPERFPPEAAAIARKAVLDKVKSLREQCRRIEPPTSDSDAEQVPDIAPAPEDVQAAASEAPAPIVEVPAEPILEEEVTEPSVVIDPKPVLPAFGRSDDFDQFRKILKEQGVEAAIAWKRERETSRIEASRRKLEEQQRTDDELLMSGEWWDAVDGAIDEFLAGEPMLRKAIVYSALSSGLKDSRIHLMAIGDSQIGKSYALRSIGSKLFPGIFIDVASMSAKSLFAAASDAENPRLFDGKILFVDELADQGDGTLDAIKALMSNGVTGVTNMTVDEHRKSKIQKLEGLPTVWSTSAEVLEDAEGQIMNRPFVVNPDETEDQTRKIMEFQRAAASIRLVEFIESKIPRARRLLERILEEKDLCVYNLFVDHVKIGGKDARARNTLPMFFNLVAAVAYAHRFARPVIELPDGRKLLFASYHDNVEAAELWGWASGPKSTGLPMRHIELLKILPIFAGSITGGLLLDEIVEIYTSKTGRKVSHKTVLNYLSDLSSKDKATYYETEDEHGKKLHLWYSTGSSHTFPTAFQLLIGMESKEGNKLLDEALKSLITASSQLPNEIRKRIEGLREELLGQEYGL